MGRTAYLVLAALALAGCGSGVSRPDPSKLAQTIGAASCQDSGYYLENRVDHSKTEVYDCLRDGFYICVIQENGIAKNVTREARLVWADTLATDEPTCASTE